MWPYSHIPFQWSAHVRERPGGKLRHHEFLAEDAADPRLRFLETLLDVLGTMGSMVVYNRQFEAERLKDLSGWLPGHAFKVKIRSTGLAEVLRQAAEEGALPFNGERGYSHSPLTRSS